MHRSTALLMGLLLGLGMVVTATAGDAGLADGVIEDWISDPAELAARGFDPHGPPLHRLSAVTPEASLEQRQAELERDIGEGDGQRRVTWFSAQGTDFRFLNESASYTTEGSFTLSCMPGSSNRFADATLQLKDDRQPGWLDVWTLDTSTTSGVDVGLYRSCQPAATPGAPVVTELALASGAGFSGGSRFQARQLPAGTFVQNSTCAYWVRAMFSDCESGTSVKLQKVRVM